MGALGAIKLHARVVNMSAFRVFLRVGLLIYYQ